MSTSTTSTAVATTAIKILSSTIRSTGTAVSTATSKALSSESLSKAATTTTAKVASVAKAVSSSTPGSLSSTSLVKVITTSSSKLSTTLATTSTLTTTSTGPSAAAAATSSILSSMTSAASAVETVETAIPSGKKAFAWAYIHAHQSLTTDPTYRYAYLFWILVGALAIVYAIAHHFRLSGGWLGAWYNKWGMKRGTVRYGPKKSGRYFVLPSNSYLVTMGVFVFIMLMLLLAGPDHIEESKGVWEMRRSLSDLKRSLEEVEIIKPLHKEHVDKSVWTLGNRFGFMAFAAMPLIVVLALKSTPFALFTIPWFTALHWDKVGTFHRAGGWFVWWMVTLHVILWVIQLFKDHYDNRPMFFAMLVIYRFRSAIVAYVAMTLAMLLSLRKVRNKSYELFYFSHVILMFIMLVFALLHHAVIWYWIGAALMLWGGDRVFRWTRGAWINGSFGSSQAIKSANPRLDAYMEKNGAPVPSIVPPGMAHAQLLPSRTVRLSIRTARPIKWQPGQSVLLNIPDLSLLQTHPFTISNNDPHEMVLVIKARKGLTRQLYDHVVAMTNAQVNSHDKRGSVIFRTEPVLMRAQIDGPLGSAGRVPWTDFSNVVIMCGGSGVTFGLAICDYLATVMSSPQFKGKTRRVRFVWIVREYAEITWAASAMCRFAHLLQGEQLQIDIFVTNGEKSTRPQRKRTPATSMISVQSPADADDSESSDDDDDGKAAGTNTGNNLRPPRPSYYELPGRERKASTDTVSSAFSVTPRSSQERVTSDIDPETGAAYNDEAAIRGLTNYGDEEDVDDAKEKRLSRAFQHEGKARRARSRRAARAASMPGAVLPPVPPMPDPATMPPPPSPPKLMVDISADLERDERRRSQKPHMQTEESRSIVATDSSATLRDTYGRLTGESGIPIVSYNDNTWAAYERYDPFGETGKLSPGASLEDLALHYKSLTSRTHDMVLLDDTPDGAGHKCDHCGRAASDQLWIDEGDYAAAKILSENARTGRPPLASILEDEIRSATGSTIVATCGPVGLNTTVRNLVSAAIDPAKIRNGDPRGYVTMYSEDFEM